MNENNASSTIRTIYFDGTSGVPEKVKLSYVFADRSLRKINKSEETILKTSWVPPSFASLHWDF